MHFSTLVLTTLTLAFATASPLSTRQASICGNKLPLCCGAGVTETTYLTCEPVFPFPQSVEELEYRCEDRGSNPQCCDFTGLVYSQGCTKPGA
ncbi:hypothetical protein GLAREA_06049 [Glarea lozoyensis ATCC 20868]|uniref:Uncharacterized protein n=1 Tax=Glarea lozoyensis (strain ATCC 20868 / MF5171) TaxID=1116229 RepID=S3D3H4_GLAL2|nr:uncharacterized protein GLAREA_06049 [Glarea lozoyensis ATCC 20868]EPE33037.1 hypothetical protein GLAREA_06049 [Glarea lozoyensis ATCC 20868]